MPADGSAEHETRHEKVSFSQGGEISEGNESPAQGYQQRNYGYNNQRQQNGYQQRPYQQRQQGYQPRPYQPRTQQGTYQPRQQGYNQNQGNYQSRQQGYGQQGYNHPGGYQPRQQGGYQPRQQGNYQPRQQQGGFQPQHQGGYQPRTQQGGYQPRQQQGGFQPRQQGNYHNRQQGGYQPRQQQGGYQQRQQGGYEQRPSQNRQGFVQNGNWKNNKPNKFMGKPKQVDYVLEDVDPNAEMRLNKYMANAGICSRREADEFITAGKVKVNGETVTELGTKISRNDVVEFNDKVVTPERKCYVLLNKPKDCVTTSDDPNGRTTVLDIVKNACEERIYPVGRLDRNTTGVLLLTNDGDLASKLTHPKFVKKKIYHVWTDKDIAEEDMQRIADGIELEDGEIHADAISYVSDERNQAGIEIHSGRNRIVRRIFEHLGYRVIKLDRVYFAGLTKKNLPRGRWRYLTQDEVNYLRMGAFE
ncbi:MAG: RNA-binding S4 domain-containing protein [Muribaculaceae bacterium]|nr:RNA-binding S4 domain-containing protein [Muribaculaceae bacterium]